MMEPGSEKLEGEPVQARREKPEEEIGASLDWKPGLSSQAGQLQGDIVERQREGSNRTGAGKQ